jgi:hypothetical protein
MVRRSALVAGVLGLAVAGGALLVAGEESPVDADKTDAKVRAIAERVEGLRGIEFRSLPKVREVSAAQLRAEAADQQSQMNGAQRAELDADGEVLKILGFIDREADLSGSAPDTADIAGTYEFDSKRLSIVKDAPTGDVPPEVIYAHELTHALEDQTFDLGDPRVRGDDTQQAYTALAEGSATFLETRYERKFLDGAVTARRIAKSKPSATERAASGPDAYAENSFRFAYLDGARFVARLQRAGGWRMVDRAFGAKPPTTSEEILHPDKYLAGETRSPVTIVAEPALGTGYKRLAQGQLGEFDTSQMLLLGAQADDEITRREAAVAAEGWDGGRYELWQARRGPSCSMPCAERDVLVLALAWDSPADIAEFVALLPGYLERFQKLRPAGAGAWRSDVAAAALAVTAKETTLVIAPTLGVARKVARRARR